MRALPLDTTGGLHYHTLTCAGGPEVPAPGNQGWLPSNQTLGSAVHIDWFLGSSMVEHPAVNRRVAGSSPARGAIVFGASHRQRFLECQLSKEGVHLNA